MNDGLRNPVAVDASGADPRASRGVFLKWLRKTHGWIGLWGAALGLVFGVTGILQNHRAVMKIPAAQTQETTVQLALPKPAPEDPNAMAQWLQSELQLDRPAGRVRSEPSRPVAWGDKSVKQPERWTAMFNSPRQNVQAEYWVGNGFVSVKRGENNVLGVLNNLHKSAGVGVGWILLADTLGGAIILLSLTGLALWTLTNRRRVIGASIAALSLAALIVLAAVNV